MADTDKVPGKLRHSWVDHAAAAKGVTTVSYNPSTGSNWKPKENIPNKRSKPINASAANTAAKRTPAFARVALKTRHSASSNSEKAKDTAESPFKMTLKNVQPQSKVMIPASEKEEIAYKVPLKSVAAPSDWKAGSSNTHPSKQSTQSTKTVENPPKTSAMARLKRVGGGSKEANQPVASESPFKVQLKHVGGDPTPKMKPATPTPITCTGSSTEEKGSPTTSAKADKELEEIRSLGLTKAISISGLTESSSHKRGGPEDELNQLRSMGLAKTLSKNGFAKDSPSGYASNKATDELSELRALGLTKASVSEPHAMNVQPSNRRSFQVEKEMKELEELRSSGLTKVVPAKEIIGTQTEAKQERASPVDASPKEPTGRNLSSPSVDGNAPTRATDELSELRALGLTKASGPNVMQAQSASRRSSQVEKEMKELEELRSRGLTKVVPAKEITGTPADVKEEHVPPVNASPNDPAVMDLPSTSVDGYASNKATDELSELRALGLTKANVSGAHAMNAQSTNRRSSQVEKEMKELEELRSRGLTKVVPAKEFTGTPAEVKEEHVPLVETSPEEPTIIDLPSTSVEDNSKDPTVVDIPSASVDETSETDQVSSTEKQLPASDTLGSTTTVSKQSEPSKGPDVVVDTASVDIIYEDHESDSEPFDSIVHNTPPPQVAKPEQAPVPTLKEKSSATIYTAEEKARQRQRRKENKDMFKGMKRFVWGKKQSDGAP